MAKIYPNMGKEFCNNPPYIANCKYCGAEAEMGGIPDWEWWTHTVFCSNRCIGSIENKTRLQRYNIKELIEKWNELNKESEQE